MPLSVPERPSEDPQDEDPIPEIKPPSDETESGNEETSPTSMEEMLTPPSPPVQEPEPERTYDGPPANLAPKKAADQESEAVSSGASSDISPEEDLGI